LLPTGLVLQARPLSARASPSLRGRHRVTGLHAPEAEGAANPAPKGESVALSLAGGGLGG
ncbi:hypothetical protein, partial [Salmonella enterica]|uniref:hypothetical protein n=1 Tax=Salmonella enterica TaxID=28901 RepID=UPI003D27AD62